MADINRMQELIDELNAASEAYYGGEKELMTNYEWDAKFDELTALEEETGIVLDGSPTHNVSKEANGAADTVIHETPALSLPKSKLESKLISWADGRPIDLSWKLDGMTLVVTWDNGRLTRIVTRGNGISGFDITRLEAAIENIPLKIPYDGHLVVRGEAVISYDDFARFNDECGNIYENPRNLVAGSLNPYTKSVYDIDDRGIIWLPFTLVSIDWDKVDFNAKQVVHDISRWSERMRLLQYYGFKTVESEFISAPNEELSGAIARWSERVPSYPYAVDGLVIVYEDTVYASTGTNTGHHNTKGGFAFKWEDEKAETTLLDIEWSPSVNSINPVAIFESVRLEGTSVSRASLCNLNEMKRLGIGGPGTKVTVIKANKIIPKIVSASVPEGVSESWNRPCECPVCKAPTEVATSENGVQTLVCSNPDCVAKKLRKFERFVSKYGMNIFGLSKSTLSKLAAVGLINSYADILTLPDREDVVRATIEGQFGIGKKTITNMMASINKAKSVKAEQFLYSLCIPMCGRDMAKQLAASFTMEDLVEIAVNDAKNGTDFILAGTQNIGDVKAKSFIEWFADDDNVKMIRNLMSICTIKDSVRIGDANTQGRCNGLVFVVTGSLQTFRSRDDKQRYIEEEGGKLASGVSKNVHYLVNNDLTSSSKKNETAKKLGIPIISEREFRDKFMD